MNSTILKCKNCKAIIVIATKDLWKIGKCPTCESRNLGNIDDEFEGEKKNEQCSKKD